MKVLFSDSSDVESGAGLCSLSSLQHSSYTRANLCGNERTDMLASSLGAIRRKPSLWVNENHYQSNNHLLEGHLPLSTIKLYLCVFFTKFLQFY